MRPHGPGYLVRWLLTACCFTAVYEGGSSALPAPEHLTSLGPLVATFAVARLILLGLAGYWLVLLGVVGLVRVCGGRRVVSALARSRWLGVRRAALLAMGASVGLAPTVTWAAAASSPGPAPTLLNISGRPATRAVAHVGRAWIVRPGDNFWSIAAAALESAWGEQPSERQVAVYWLAVTAANRGRLPHPGEPDLLYPGDVVVLPHPGTL